MSSAIIVHGGAGDVALERHARLREGVRAAAAAGDAVLQRQGSAVDAVVAAVRVLEDDPEYNAGTGSVLTRAGTVETDACVMDGRTQRAGAVGAVPDLGNAIALAHEVMKANEHVLLAGSAAWAFAATVGITPAAPGSLVTERAKARLASPGTVGAVARDHAGSFAAATSTGGISGKRQGRIGDTPIVGAGTWSDERCALSATGDGEAIMRVALTRSIAMRLAAGARLEDAVNDSLRELHRITQGSAGVIGVDRYGVIGVQLSATMPIASIVRDPELVEIDSLGDRITV